MTVLLSRFLDALTLRSPLRFGPVTLVPLRLGADHSLLDVALLNEDTARIREVGENGIVGRLRVESLTALPLLLVQGELLRGAKQDRLLNASVLIGPRSEREVSVSCVEQGRWAFGAREDFVSAGATAPWRLRSSAALRSSRPRRQMGTHDADQSSVWSDVRHHLRMRQVHSGTENLLDAIEDDRARQGDAFASIDAWQPEAREVGAVFFVDGATTGMEVFCAPDAWAQAGRRILHGLCADAATRGDAPSDPTTAAQALLARVRTMETTQTRGDGPASELHGEAQRTHLTALTVDPGAIGDGAPGGVVHLRVARLDTEPPPSRIQRSAAHRALRERPSVRPEPSRGNAAMDRFEIRERQRRKRRVKIGHLEARDHLSERVAVSGACLVVPLPTYERALRGHLSEGLFPPIPHRCGGGLVLWRSRGRPGLHRIEAALHALGVPDSLCFQFDPSGDVPGLPRWLQVTPGSDHTTLLSLVDR